jgi:serine/threonine protein kinase
MDRRWRAYGTLPRDQRGEEPHTSAANIIDPSHKETHSHTDPTLSTDPYEEEPLTARLSQGFDDRLDDLDNDVASQDDFSDTRSITSTQYAFDNMIHNELETTWILNLSMRYKDHSNREKFFVTYRESKHNWRRVTVTLDYRHAPDNSLERELYYTKLQRDKSRKVYEAIRESLREIMFCDTVTNLKLETIDDRLHVHVVEDANVNRLHSVPARCPLLTCIQEIINYPHVSQVAHLGCRRVREQDLIFDHHMSGFVYKVSVGGEPLIKKEIPGPDTIEEFLYEINALNSLTYSDHVIKFYGLVVDEDDERVKGLLISYADGGALVDIIYDNCKDKNFGLQWSLKERWARQIVHGLADVHESGFVQGDFTLSNIVIDENDNAKIIDINRRGCPVGWEPPEATPLIESGHRISMYIGVKSDLFQLGMVLWALAMEEDEPEREGRPLTFGPEPKVPEWYQRVTEICLDPDPRKRLPASMLLQLFPEELPHEPHISVEEGISAHSLPADDFRPDSQVRVPAGDLPTDWWRTGRAYTPTGPPAYQSWQYAPRGRSPPSPLPSNFDDGCESRERLQTWPAWAANKDIRPSYSDVGEVGDVGSEVRLDGFSQRLTPSPSAEVGLLPESIDIERDETEPHVQVRSGVAGPVPESAQENTIQDSIEVLVVEHPLGANDEVEGPAARESTPRKEQPPVSDGTISPDIMAKAVRNVSGSESKVSLTDTHPPEANAQNTPVCETTSRDAEATTPDIKEDPAEAEHGDKPGAAEPAIPLPETQENLEDQASSGQKAPTSSESQDSLQPKVKDDAESGQAKPEDLVLPTDEGPQGSSMAFESIPETAENGRAPAGEATVIPAHSTTDSAMTDVARISDSPAEGGVAAKRDVTTTPPTLVQETPEEIKQIQDNWGTDDCQVASTGTTPVESAACTTARDVSTTTPKQDANQIPISKSGTGDISPENAADPSMPAIQALECPDTKGSDTENVASEMLSGATGLDTHKDPGSAALPIAPTTAGTARSEAESRAVTNGSNMEREETATNYDVMPMGSAKAAHDVMQIPDTLAGIGSGHMTIDDNLWREKDIFQDDFPMVSRPDVIPAIMITTDATT